MVQVVIWALSIPCRESFSVYVILLCLHSFLTTACTYQRVACFAEVYTLAAVMCVSESFWSSPHLYMMQSWSVFEVDKPRNPVSFSNALDQLKWFPDQIQGAVDLSQSL